MTKALYSKLKNKAVRIIKQAKENEAKARMDNKIKAKNKKDINELVRKWENQMAHYKCYNDYYDIYTLAHLAVTPYGIKGKVALPDGMGFEQLESILPKLEQNLECKIAFNRKGRRIVENIEFIKRMPNQVPFQLVKVKPWEICLGLDYTGKPMVKNMIKQPHMVNSGSTGGGKSFCIDHILINLIANNKPEDVQLYLLQMEKDDMILYKNVEHCRAYASELNQFYIVMNYIEDLMNIRSKLIAPYREKALANNYIDYNKIEPRNKMSTIYVVIDEIASLFNLTGVKKSEKEIKQYVGMMTERIAQIGRALGIFLIVSVQRPTANMFSSFVKSMMNITVSFRHENSKSSEVALDNSNIALGLKQREFVVKEKGGFEFGIVPLMNTKELYDTYLKPNLKKTKRDLFSDLKKLAKNSGKDIDIGVIIPTKDREKVNKENESLLVKENISKIPGYVPWDGNKPEQPKKKLSNQVKRERERV